MTIVLDLDTLDFDFGDDRIGWTCRCGQINRAIDSECSGCGDDGITDEQDDHHV